MKGVAIIVSMSLGLGVVAASAQEAALFTKAQALRGEEAYESACAQCHGRNLIATDPEAANMTGRSFNSGWVGQTIASRFERIKKTMPAGRPGSLDDQMVLDIVAYILSFNKYPAGDQELRPDRPLGTLVIPRAP